MELSMSAAMIALREAVNKACKFLGPGSRTGNNLEKAMLAAEREAREGAASPAVEAAAGEPFDNGPWTYRTDPKAETHVGRYFIESDDFSHDVRLYINGDFGSDEDRRAYGEALAATLNRAIGTPAQAPR
jgi:hypothetical protein